MALVDTLSKSKRIHHLAIIALCCMCSDEESVGVVADMTEKTLGEVLMKRLLFNSQRWKIGKYSLPKFR